jgi:5'-3' exonuclease
MGIPAFAKTITNKYPHIITHHIPSQCGRLFLDLNCAIHPVAQRAMQHYNNDASYETTVIQNVIRYIQKIVSFAKPQQLMFVAIDGIPPRAKMHQQRKRRYMSAWRKNMIKTKTGIDPFPWDTNAITPGTGFMNKLSAGLNEHFSTSKYPFKVILRDSNNPGEGEAKIMQYIREPDAAPIARMHDIIYGLDADLIMLSLASIRHTTDACNDNISKPAIYLLREPPHYEIKQCSKPFLYFDVNALHNCIEKEMGKNRVWDYVALCFLLGNDFMPPLSYLKIKNNGIQKLLTAYRTTIESSSENEYLVSPDGILHLDILLRVLENLKETEDAEIQEAEKTYFKETESRFIKTNDVVQRISNELDTYPMKNKSASVKPEKPGWRPNYYHMLFKTTDIKDVNNICLNYLEGFVWTHAYYFTKQCVSYDWMYRYEYSPTIVDLNNFLSSFGDPTQANQMLVDIKTSIVKRNPRIEYNTDLQLLIVLPPSSKHLLKHEFAKLMTDVSLGCVHMYPDTFSIGTYLKTFLWECHPELPPVDVTKVSLIARSVAAVSS